MMINERIDDLMRDGLKLIQNTDIFCFGMDAVLLSTYARAGKKDRVLDMGTGNGIIPVLMQSKNPGSTYSALEIQEGSAQLARRNVELNHLENRISVVKGDIKEASTIFGEASFNVVTSNPPYMNENHGIVNPDSAKAIARHEYEVYKDGEKIGIITSGGPSPMLGANIALAYVKNDKEICTGSIVQVMIREKLHDAEIVKRPFIEKRNKIKL